MEDGLDTILQIVERTSVTFSGESFVVRAPPYIGRFDLCEYQRGDILLGLIGHVVHCIVGEGKELAMSCYSRPR